jgi:hypothetical protein
MSGSEAEVRGMQAKRNPIPSLRTLTGRANCIKANVAHKYTPAN